MGFKSGEAIVYPAHGVGRITAIEEQEIAGFKLELYVVSFDKDKMTLRVPTGKATSVGMRKLAEPDTVKRRWRRADGPRPHASDACGAAAPRNTRPRSIPAT